MSKRRVPFVAALKPLAAALLLMAPVVEAVELGTLSLQSASGQPLQATIALSDTEGLDADDIRVQLASAADFERFSLERLAALETLQIDVDFSGAAPVLKLTSPVTINEPFLSLVLDTRWPAGRVLTEYMIRLESPAFSAGSAQNSSTPVRTETVPLENTAADSEPAAPVVTNAPVAGSSTAPAAPTTGNSTASRAQTQAPVISNASTITVNAGDTLWELAQRVRPDTSVSIQQTMVALQRMNPQAFIAGNINRVRRGEVLQVPELSDIRRIAAAEAVAEVSRQNREFASGAAVPRQPAANTAAGGRNNAQGELRVLTVEEDANSQQPSAGGSGNQTAPLLEQQIESLEDRIALSEEDLSRLDVENEELNARLALLQQQISAAQEIIRLRDLELAQLQQQLAQENASAPSAATEPPVITMAPAAGPLERFLNLLTSNTWAMLGAAGALVLLLVLLMGWRNRSAALAKAQAAARENDNIALGAEEDELLFTAAPESAGEAAAPENDAATEPASVGEQASAAYQAVQNETGDDSTDDAGAEASDDWQPDDFSDTGLDDIKAEVADEAAPADDAYRLDIVDDLPSTGATDSSDFDLEDVPDSETGADLSWPDEERAGTADPVTAAEVADEFDISLPDDDPQEPAPATSRSVADEFDDLAFLPSEDEFTDEALAAADDDEDDFGFLSDSDEVATKLDLARAYIDMGDADGAREILDEVLKEGTDEQRKDAQELLGRL
ncbi:MAG TPA: FimV/HubP family polar landmark protein [Pseudohongiella sp.]|nr:FimV/HubP family polar landmark protein [Pseudohongiella sp.]